MNFIIRTNRLGKALQEDQFLQFAMQEYRHNLPPVEAVLVDQLTASKAKQIADLPENIELVPQRTQRRHRAIKLASPARIAVHASEPEIDNVIPSKICPRTFFRIIFRVDE